MIDLVIAGGRVLDPARGVDGMADVVVDGGRIAAVVAAGEAPAARRTIDAHGLWVTPGMIDVHVHLREPGGAHKETIAAGVAAAVAGGFTTVAAMANTDPVNDSVDVTRWIRTRADAVGLARVLPIAAVTHGLAGEMLTDFAALRAAGAVAFSDDGVGIARADVMRQALVAARTIGVTVIAHAEDKTLAAGGVMHAGAVAERLGLPGIVAAAEESMIARDCALAVELGARLHVAHVSTTAAVALIRAARAAGGRVTGEATPHHFTLDHEAVARHGTLAKMNPPLRTPADVAAVRAGIADGALGVIASDHAPHHADEKGRGMREAPFGIVGLETMVGLACALVHDGVIDPVTMVRALTAGPADALGIPGGRLDVGAAADVTLVDPTVEWIVDPAAFRSLGRNTPFGGRRLRGRAAGVLLGGRPVGVPEERNAT